jgi:hypothetical protein
MRRNVEASEVANAFTFLASGQTSGIIAINLGAGGG